MDCQKCPASNNVCEGGEKGDWFCIEFLKKLELYIAEVMSSSPVKDQI